jgi:drug/metabolite transporter (DMT)-like permease
VTPLLTAFALVAFASNSILCRLALAPKAIDAGSFTLVRLASGAVVLSLIRGLLARRGGGAEDAPGRDRGAAAAPFRGLHPWVPGLLLFLYAAPFSFAYVRIGAGTGALILFACVQATMLVGGIRSGERFDALEVLGLAAALLGLVCLVAPGVSAPSPLGSALMAVAGVSWGLYSLVGRGSRDPLTDTARNFLRSVPPAILVGLATLHAARFSTRGILLAAASGALASGLGYSAWYSALRGLTAIRASILQLLVPMLAAVGGVLLLAEPVTGRLVVAASLIVGGVGIVLAGRARLRQS